LRIIETFLIFLKLGFTAFGGPIAHLGFFQRVFVEEKRWLSPSAYAELLALCQFLPGPASSQVGFAIGLHRAGLGGAMAAWLGFTLPSAIIMVTLGSGLFVLDPESYEGALRGLKAAAVAVVAWAIWGMGRNLCPDSPRLLIAGLAAAVALLGGMSLGWPIIGQISAIVLGALIAPLLIQSLPHYAGDGLSLPIKSRGAWVAGTLFLGGLLILPLIAWIFPTTWLAVIDAMYRAGALVFGGGHVVLPLLYAETVANDFVEGDAFLAAYGAAQALPGPLFSFGGFIGSAAATPILGLLALLALFLPGCLILLAVLPFWARIRKHRRIRIHLAGINAAVVGILTAAFIDPVLRLGITDVWDALLGITVFILLASGRIPVFFLITGAGMLAYLFL